MLDSLLSELLQILETHLASCFETFLLMELWNYFQKSLLALDTQEVSEHHHLETSWLLVYIFQEYQPEALQLLLFLCVLESSLTRSLNLERISHLCYFLLALAWISSEVKFLNLLAKFSNELLRF